MRQLYMRVWRGPGGMPHPLILHCGPRTPSTRKRCRFPSLIFATLHSTVHYPFLQPSNQLQVYLSIYQRIELSFGQAACLYSAQPGVCHFVKCIKICLYLENLL